MSNASPNVGENVTFTITVSNAGPNAATNVELKDYLPVGYQFVNSTSLSQTGSILTGSVANLPKDSSKIFTYVAKVLPPVANGTAKDYTNKTEITKSDQYDPDSKPNTGTEDSQDDTDKKSVTPQISDLSLIKLASNQQPNVGDTITYTIKVKNAGPVMATNVQVRDLLPVGLQFISSPDFVLTGTNTLTSNNILTIPMGIDILLTFKAKVLQSGAITNKAQITKSDQFDPNSTPSNGTDNNEDDTDGVTIGGQQADLSLTKTVDNALPNAGDVVTYTIIVTNAGPSTATNVEVKDILPSGLEFVSSTDFTNGGNTLTASIAQVVVGTPRVLTFKARVLTPTPACLLPTATCYLNKAQITKSDQQDPDSQVNTGTEDGQDDTDAASMRIRQADLKLQKLVSNGMPTIGEEITYSIILTNDGPDPATGVEITDVLPAGLTFLNSTDFIQSPVGTLKATVNSIADGTARTLTFKAKVTTSGAIRNEAQITKSNQFDPDSQPNTGTKDGQDDTDGVSIGSQSVDLSLKKTVSNLKPNIGDIITYTVNVKNSGFSDATNVEVKDYLPIGLTFVNSTQFQANGTVLTAKIQKIAVGDSVNLTLQAQVNSSQPLTNKAEISKADQFDADSTPNNGTENGEDDTDRVTIGSQVADLSLLKAVSNPNGTVGDVVTFTLTVANSGPDAATNVVVKDVLPDGLTFVSSSDFAEQAGALISKDIVLINKNASATLTFLAKITKAGAIVNKAEIIKSDQLDPDSKPNTGTEDGQDDIGRVILNGQQADLGLTKDINNPSPNVGEFVIYTIKVRNAGPNKATNVEVQDQIPAGLLFDTSSDFTASATQPTLLTKNIDSISVGQEILLTFRAKVLQAGTIVNKAQITKSDQFDPDSMPSNGTTNGEDDTDDASLTTQAADLEIKKSVSAGPYNVGDEVTYSLVVKNNGPSTATMVIVKDSLPNNLTFVSGNAFVNMNNVLISEIGSIASGTSQTLTFKAKIVKSGTIQNVGVITKADQLDPKPINNKDSVKISTQAAADLSLQKLVNNRVPSVGNEVEFSLIVRNAGPDAAANVQVKDYLPTTLEYVSGADFTPQSDGKLLSRTIASIASKDSVVLKFKAKVLANTAIINKAEISKSDQFDPDSSPNTGTEDGQDDASGISLNGQEADLSLKKDASNTNPNIGDLITYTIKLTNAGPTVGTNVSIEDKFPIGLEFVSSGDFIKVGNVLTANVPSINVAETKILTYIAKVLPPTAAGILLPIINKAQVAKSDQFDPDSRPNSGTEDGQDDTDEAVMNIQQADLSLKKTIVGMTDIKVNSVVTYNLTVTNSGPNAATNVEVKDILPDGLELINAIDFAVNGTTLTSTIPNLPAGSIRTLSFVAKITKAGNVKNLAEITKSDQYDPDSKPGNGTGNTEDDRAEVNTIGRAADLLLTKSTSDTLVNPGQAITYTIEITNQGPDPVGQFNVKDYLPSSLEFISSKFFVSNGNTLSATIFNVKKDSVVKLTYTTRVSKTYTPPTSNLLVGNPQLVRNVAEIASSDTPDSDSTPGNGPEVDEDDRDDAVVRVRVADLSLRKLVSNAMPTVGQVIDYKLVVRNDGPDVATNIEVKDFMPAGLEFISSNDFFDNSGVLLSRKIAQLAKFATDTLRFKAKVLVSGPIVNRAEITKVDQLDPDSQPNTGTTDGQDDVGLLTIGGSQADLSLTKAVSDANPNIGDVVTYTIQVKNAGPSAATNVQVKDLLPLGLQLISTNDFTRLSDSTLLSRNIATIAVNSQVTLSYVVKITEFALSNSRNILAGGRVKNRAEVFKADQYDPDSQPNTGFDDGQDDAADVIFQVQGADLSLSKAVSNKKPFVGDVIDYTLTVTNDGPNNATNVEVRDILPAGLQFVGGAGFIQKGDSVSTKIPLINAGTTKSVTFQAKVIKAGGITNRAEITKADQFDPDSKPNNGPKGEDDEAGVRVNGEQADLSLKKIVSNARPNVGDIITYTLTVKNTGPDAATNVEVKDKLPKELAFIESNDVVNIASVLYGIIKKIPADSSVRLTYKARVISHEAFENRAEISKSDQFDPDSQPNTGTKDGQDDTDFVKVTPKYADVSLTKLASKLSVSIGAEITFTLKVKNAGPDSATNVIIKDVLPAGLEFVRSSTMTVTNDNVLTSKPLNVAINKEDSVTFVAKVTKDGVILNKAEIVKANQFDPDSKPNTGTEDGEDDNARVAVGGEQSDLSLEKSVDEEFVNVGENTTFTLKVKNAGPSAATNVAVVDYLPKGLEFVSSSDFKKDSDTLLMSRLIQRIEPNQTIALKVTVKMRTPLSGSASAYVLTNRAEIVKSDQFDIDSQPNTGTKDDQDDQSSATVRIPSADLSIRKTVTPQNAPVGSTVTYKIVVLNEGPSTATNIEVKDYLPKGLSNIETKDLTVKNDTLTAKITRLVSGASRELIYTAKVTKSGNLTNVAAITKADQFDSNKANNRDQVTTGGKAIDLSLMKTVNKPNANLGEQVTYKLVVKNAGPDTATNVVIKDLLPAGLGFVASTDFRIAGSSVISRTIMAIPPKGEETLEFVAKVKDKGMIMNKAEVFKADEFDTDSKPGNGPENGEDDEAQVMLNGEQADLSLIKKVADYGDTPNVGDTITYVLEVRNAGPAIATNVQVSDAIPAGLQVVSLLDFKQLSATSTTIIATIDSIKVGSSKLLKFKAKVTSNGGQEVANTIINRAEITKSDQFDPDSQPNSGVTDGQDDVGYYALMPQIADLSLRKNVSNRNPKKGETFTYTLTVYNQGPAMATNVEVTDKLPAEIEMVASQDFKKTDLREFIKAKIPAIAAGTSQTVSFEARIRTENQQPIINYAQISKSDQFDSDSKPNNGYENGEDDEASVIINGKTADLSLRKTVDNAKPNLNDEVVYTLTVRNAGPDEATNVQLQDVLPKGISFVESLDFNHARGIVRNNVLIPIIAPNDSVSLSFVAKVDKFVDNCILTNKAEILKAVGFDPDSKVGNGFKFKEDDIDSVNVCVQSADLSLLKKPSKYVVKPNEEFEYTITVSNAGPVAATNVEVADILPAGLKFVSSDDDVTNNKGKVGFFAEKIEAGKKAVWKFKVKLIATDGKPVTNQAQIIASDQFDVDSRPDNGLDNGEDDETATTINGGEADLSLRKDVAPMNANVGQNVTFTITVTNNGPNAATNVQVKDMLPAGLKFVSSNDFDYNSSNKIMLAGIDSLALGAKVKLRVIAKVLAQGNNPKPRSANKAEIYRSNQFDSDSCPGTGTEDGEDDTDSVEVNGPWADLSLQKFVSDSLPMVGAEVTFKLRVKNSGPGKATRVIVRDALPDGLTLTDRGDFIEKGGVLTSNMISTIPANGSFDLTFRARVTKGGLITNKAEIVDVKQYDPDSQPNTGTEDGQDDVGVVTLVGQQADLALTKQWSCGQSKVAIGDTLNYVLKIENFGPAYATNVQVVDYLPAGISLITTAGGIEKDGKLTFNIDRLDKKEFKVFIFKAKVTQAGTITNTAEVTKSDQPDPDSKPGNGIGKGEDDEASTKTEVIACRIVKPIVTASKTSICDNETATLKASACAGSITWSSGQTGASIDVKPIVKTAYTATCKLGTGCEAKSDSLVVNVGLVAAAPIITASKTAICGSETVTLTAKGCAGDITWSNAATGSSIDVKPTATTAYFATCKTTASCGIANGGKSEAITIIVGGKIEAPQLSCNKQNICLGDSAIINAVGCEGIVKWSNGATGKAITVKPTMEAYGFSATCQSTGGCVSDASRTFYFVVTKCTNNQQTVVASKKASAALCMIVGEAKRIDSTKQIYEIPYTLRVVNVGNADLTNIQVINDLNETFTRSGAVIISEKITVKTDVGLKANTYFNGDRYQNLLADSLSNLPIGSGANIDYLVTVDFSKSEMKTFYNSALVKAKAGVTNVADISNDGMVVDPDGDQNPNNDSKPTPFFLNRTIAQAPEPLLPKDSLSFMGGISPNDDGLNDLWVIKGLKENNLKASVTIVNRWGGVVYVADDYQNDFGGKGNHGIRFGSTEDLPDGTYFYIANISDGRRYVKFMVISR